MLAGQLDRDGQEDRGPRNRVADLEESCVEVDLRRERRDPDQRRHPDDQERRYGLIEKVGVNVRSLLQNEDIATRPLRGANLPPHAASVTTHECFGV